MLVTIPDTQVAVQRQFGLLAEGQGTLAATLAEHQQDVQVEVDIGQLEAHQLPRRAPVSSRSMMRTVSRRALEALPSHSLRRRRQPSPGITGTGCSGMMGGFILAIGLGTSSSSSHR